MKKLESFIQYVDEVRSHQLHLAPVLQRHVLDTLTIEHVTIRCLVTNYLREHMQNVLGSVKFRLQRETFHELHSHLKRWDFRRVRAVTTLDSRPVWYLWSFNWELTMSTHKYETIVKSVSKLADKQIRYSRRCLFNFLWYQ